MAKGTLPLTLKGAVSSAPDRDARGNRGRARAQTRARSSFKTPSKNHLPLSNQYESSEDGSLQARPATGGAYETVVPATVPRTKPSAFSQDEDRTSYIKNLRGISYGRKPVSVVRRPAVSNIRSTRPTRTPLTKGPARDGGEMSRRAPIAAKHDARPTMKDIDKGEKSGNAKAKVVSKSESESELDSDSDYKPEPVSRTSFGSKREAGALGRDKGNGSNGGEGMDDDDLSSLSSNSGESVKGVNDSDNGDSSDENSGEGEDKSEGNGDDNGKNDGEDKDRSQNEDNNDSGDKDGEDDKDKDDIVNTNESGSESDSDSENENESQQKEDMLSGIPKADVNDKDNANEQSQSTQSFSEPSSSSLLADGISEAGSSADDAKQAEVGPSNGVEDKSTALVFESMVMASDELGESCSAVDESLGHMEPLVVSVQAYQGAELADVSGNGNGNGNDDGWIGYADGALDEAVGPGTSADLMVLDYISNRVIDKVVEMSAVEEQESGSDVHKRQLECLGREQVMFRRLHFTRSPFLFNEQRPEDEGDMAQWAESMHRINIASFALMIMCPQLVVTESPGCSLPNRKRALISSGLSKAVDSFFSLVVPQNKRDGQSLDILLDMQTQQWLLAADDERQLQATVKQVRGMDDSQIARLLEIDTATAAALTEDDPDGPMDNFDASAIPEYRQIVGRRLNKISGGRLHIARSQYTLAGLKRRVAQFVGECAKMLSPPLILAGHSVRNDIEDASFIIDDEPDDISELELPVNGAVEGANDSQSSQISGDFEVTIYQNRDELERLRSNVRKLNDAISKTGTVAKAAKRAEATNGAPSSESKSGAVVDPSFTEERRIATFIRDSLSDEHLDLLIDAITAESTDIQTMQKQILSRMYTGSNNDSAQVSPDNAKDRQPSAANEQYADDDFRLNLNLSEENESGGDDRGHDNGASAQAGDFRPLSEHRSRIALAQDQTRTQTRQLRAKRTKVDYSEADIERDFGGDNEENHAEQEEEIINAILRPKKRGRIQYGRAESSQAPSTPNGFRGRRGIPAEDPATFGDQQERVSFTPSDHGSPFVSPSLRPEVERSEAYMSPARPLGQYEPARMVRDESVQTPVFGKATGRRKKAGPAPVRNRWTQEEEECFIRAVCSYGLRWSLILQYHGPDGSIDQVLRNRTRVHLKDKARNIKTRLIREGKQLGPFADAVDR
ncbi:TTAGGG repeat binding factor [Coemansia sp. RSA 1722]|nr:TTAGGG repeat binding factor [Coemansia sp. RSA 486]KAJ2237864.1 TTAGGG repeat binding factor [Coemansia sp. RSA 485]KAJ2603294.1 TTAGGG repeat binding factor [Coemansia sp. RSA 1721]KAJ2605924.1 TTAGGG repeat binding factor [Coemansia sp. RSA 1722]KAJ2639916.1 TTAGGG repeat binding factor [Coemansia sp. RSA 1286]